MPTVALPSVALLDTLAALAGIAYVEATRWSTVVENNEGLRLPRGRAAGDLALVDVHVVVAGVAHEFGVADDKLADALVRQQARWDRESAEADAEQQRFDELVDAALAWARDDLADELVADSDWLLLPDRRGRDLHADRLLEARYPDAARVQGVRGFVRGAVSAATRVRDAEVVPARTEAFRRDLDIHAAELAGREAFARATTKADRTTLARDAVTAADPLVPPHKVLTELVVRATGVLAAQRRGDDLLSGH